MIQMKLTSNNLMAGKPSILRFTPLNYENPTDAIILEKVHGQPLHLIIVREDLSFFSHQHPQWNTGAYELEFVFPSGGTFLLFVDYKPLSQPAKVDRLQLIVSGDQDAPARFATEQLSWSKEEINVVLDTEQLMALKARVFEGGISIAASQIEDFLGAKAHVVMIHTGSKAFIHVHPMVHGEKLILHPAITETGMYRIWVQFMYKGNFHTADFTLNMSTVPSTSMMMHHHH